MHLQTSRRQIENGGMELALTGPQVRGFRGLYLQTLSGQ